MLLTEQCSRISELIEPVHVLAGFEKGKVFLCISCGYKEDTYLNASKNIDRAGRAQKACGGAAIGVICEAGTSGLAFSQISNPFALATGGRQHRNT